MICKNATGLTPEMRVNVSDGDKILSKILTACKCSHGSLLLHMHMSKTKKRNSP
jgi:hypothetical protein